MITRPMLILILTCALAAACSQSSSQSGNADKSAGTPPAAAAAAQAPANQPAASPAAGAAQSGAAPAPAQTERAPQQAAAAAPPSSEPAPPPEPEFREVTIPAETPMSVTLETPVASNKSRPEDQVRGRLAGPIVVAGVTVVPAGSEVIGSIIDARESGRVKGKASVAFRFSRLTVRGESIRIQTAKIAREAASSTKSDVKKGAFGAGAGALIGGIAGGGSGAAIGATVGGAGTVLATKGHEVELPSGTRVSTRLLEAVKVEVPLKEK
jgi:hypothetical protein